MPPYLLGVDRLHSVRSQDRDFRSMYYNSACLLCSIKAPLSLSGRHEPWCLGRAYHTIHTAYLVLSPYWLSYMELDRV